MERTISGKNVTVLKENRMLSACLSLLVTGHFRINTDFLLFLTPLFLLNHLLFNLFLFWQKREGGVGFESPPASQLLPLRGPCCLWFRVRGEN